MGPHSVLSKNEEEKICKWIVKMASGGFPITIKELTASVESVIKDMKCKVWVKAFIKRNSTISKMIS